MINVTDIKSPRLNFRIVPEFLNPVIGDSLNLKNKLNFDYFQLNSPITIIDQWDISQFSTAKYYFTFINGSVIEYLELTLLSDGSYSTSNELNISTFLFSVVLEPPLIKIVSNIDINQSYATAFRILIKK